MSRSLEERVSRLEEDASYEPIRLAPIDVTSTTQIYKTANDPGGNYPQATLSNGVAYYGKIVSISGNQFGSVGSQGFSPTPTDNGNYFYNLGISYIPINTLIPVWEVGGSFFTIYSVTAIYVGTATADITMTAPLQFPTPQISVQFQSNLTATVPVQNIYNLSIPKGMNCQVQQNYNGLVLTGPYPYPINATLNSDITPGGSGLATPQKWGGSAYVPDNAIGQITASDWAGVGGLSGKNCFVMFNGSWVMFYGNPCA